MEKIYDNSDCNRFVKDAEENDFEWEHYYGRNYWQGPAVNCDHYSDVMAITSVKCQYDNMGMGYVVYPVRRGKMVGGA